MSILGNIPILGNILGGGGSSGGLAGGILDMTGIPQLIEKGFVLYIAVVIALKLVDKI